MEDIRFVEKGEGFYVSEEMEDDHPNVYLGWMLDENEDVRLNVALRFGDRVIQLFLNPKHLGEEPGDPTDETPFEILDTDMDEGWTRRYAGVFTEGLSLVEERAVAQA